MKVAAIEGFANGSFRITLESEHPAELALIKLLNGCEGKSEATAPTVHPEQNVVPGTPSADPLLQISLQIRKERY